jgi:hypothetical protein
VQVDKKQKGMAAKILERMSDTIQSLDTRFQLHSVVRAATLERNCKQ